MKNHHISILYYDCVAYEVIHRIKSPYYEKISINCYTYELESMKSHAIAQSNSRTTLSRLG